MQSHTLPTYATLADEGGCAVQYYNGQWTYHPQVKLGIASLSATRDLIEQSVRTQLLSLKPNVTIKGGTIAESLVWDEQKTRVQGGCRQARRSRISLKSDVAHFIIMLYSDGSR